MRKTLGLLFLFSFLAASLVGFSAYCQEDISFVGDSAFTERMRPSVPFLHDDHNEMANIEDCNECHHVWEDGKKLEWDSSEDKECSECHLSQESGDSDMDLIKAYHNMCKECHIGQKAGPVQCSECHIK